MKKVTQEELNKIIENHKLWLSDVNKNIYSRNYLRADLHEADISDLDLSKADLRFANLVGSDLSYANLKLADLREACLSGSDLRFADLRFADLRYARLSGANIGNADLRYADLNHADMRLTRNTPYIPMACPEEGEFIGYKKASGKIVVLSIPSDAKRSSATGRKCRCDKATVLSIDEIGGKHSGRTKVTSDHDSKFVYRVGETVTVDNFDENRLNECAPGIHFFINRREAEEY